MTTFGRVRAFTLIELLVSLTICMAVTGVSFAVFRQFVILQQRTQARILMHASMSHVYEQLSADVAHMHQGCAFFAEAQAESASGAGDGVVRLAWMTTRMSATDFQVTARGGRRNTTGNDLGWVYWVWSEKTGLLSRATFFNNGAFGWQTWNETISGNNRNFAGLWAYVFPQPRRVAQAIVAGVAKPAPINDATIDPPAIGSVMAARLGDNAFGSSTAQDRGDWYWLTRKLEPMVHQAESLAVEVVNQNASIDSVEADTSVIIARDGIPLDGDGGGAFATSMPLRPKLIRLRLILRDRNLGLSQKFSFSFPTPGTLLKP